MWLQIRFRLLFLLFFVFIPVVILHAEILKDKMTVSFDYYGDNGGLTVLSPIVAFYKKISDKFMLSARIRVDAITAATKSYGGRAVGIDAVTGATPTGNFDEVRYAPSLTGIYNNGDNSASFGGYYSTERDYTGRAFFANYTRQLNEQNTAIGIGFSQSFDKWRPFFKRDMPDNRRYESKADLSVTQLLSPTLSAQITYSYLYSGGFLSSPYHYLLTDKFAIFERYPSNRTGNAIALGFVKLLDEPTSLHMNYRFYKDDWNISSHTLNTELYRDVAKNLTLGGRYRYYTQTGANFMKDLGNYSLYDNYIAVDYKMSAFKSNTVGLSAIYRPEWKEFTLLDTSKLTIKASADYYWTSDNAYIKYWYDNSKLKAVFTSLSFDYEF